MLPWICHYLQRHDSNRMLTYENIDEKNGEKITHYCNAMSSFFLFLLSSNVNDDSHLFLIVERHSLVLWLACLLDDEVQLHYDSSEYHLRRVSSSENTLEEKTEKFNIEYK